MYKTQENRKYRTSLILAAAVAGAGLVAGCVTSPTATDTTAHQWDAHEDAAYQRYLMDEHRQHREFASLSPQEQRDYWDWRARHPGN